jgi:MFS family permease
VAAARPGDRAAGSSVRGDLQRELGASGTGITWMVTASLLVASIATPILGRLGDMFGKERLLAVSPGLFAVGSVVSALSGSLAGLMVGRVLATARRSCSCPSRRCGRRAASTLPAPASSRSGARSSPNSPRAVRSGSACPPPRPASSGSVLSLLVAPRRARG